MLFFYSFRIDRSQIVYHHVVAQTLTPQMADVLAESNNDVGPTVNSSKHHLGNSTTATDGDSVGGKALLPVEFVVVLVLALSLIHI